MIKTTHSHFRPLTRQRGVSFLVLIVIFAMIAMVGLVGLKILPAYLDAFSVKKILGSMASSEEVKSGTVKEIRDSFDRRANIDNVNSIKGSDLEITKENNEAVVVAAWTQRIPLFTNYTLLIDFNMSTSDK